MYQIESTVKCTAYASEADKNAKKVLGKDERTYKANQFEEKDWDEHKEEILKLANAKFKINQDDRIRAEMMRKLGDYRYKGKSAYEKALDDMEKLGLSRAQAKAALAKLGVTEG